MHRVYIGESHRSLPFRLERHIDDYRPLLRKRRGGGAVGRRPGGLGGGEVGGGGGGLKGSSSWMWDHVADAHRGQGREEPHQDFIFYLTSSFIKPLERQVDEMRRLDRVGKEGRATIMVKGKVKEIKTSMESLNRKEERYNLGGGRVRASFGQPKGNQRPPAPAPPAPPAPPPPPLTAPPAPPPPAPTAPPPSPPPTLQPSPPPPRGRKRGNSKEPAGSPKRKKQQVCLDLPPTTTSTTYCPFCPDQQCTTCATTTIRSQHHLPPALRRITTTLVAPSPRRLRSRRQAKRRNDPGD